MASNGADGSYTKPRPRQPKTPTQLALIRIQNRRREYLRKNPNYLNSLEHELADPVLYERLVKRFQTPAERTSEGKAKGYGRTLEADLVRGETRLANLSDSSGAATSSNTPSLLAVDRPWDGDAASKEHGLELWRAFVEERFVRGADEDFDYAAVDGSEDLDAVEWQDAEDAWFEDQEPDSGGEDGAHVKTGETGIQDF